MWVRASQENRPNTKDLSDLWYVTARHCGGENFNDAS